MAIAESPSTNADQLLELPDGSVADYFVAPVHMRTVLCELQEVVVVWPRLQPPLSSNVSLRLRHPAAKLPASIDNESSEFTEIGFDRYYDVPLLLTEVQGRVVDVLTDANKTVRILGEVVDYSEIDLSSESLLSLIIKASQGEKTTS